MGQHTWFYKDIVKYEKEVEIDNKLQDFYDQIIWLEPEEVLQLEHESDQIHRENETLYHDVFRTWKRDPDGCYTTDVIKSKLECLQWLEDNKEFVDQTKINKKLLNEFWNEYPKGVIDFG